MVLLTLVLLLVPLLAWWKKSDVSASLAGSRYGDNRGKVKFGIYRHPDADRTPLVPWLWPPAPPPARAGVFIAFPWRWR